MTDIAIRLPPSLAALPPVLATGAWFKNALCGVRDGEARLSRVVGDLATPEACVGHEAEAAALLAWLGQPAAVAHDLHPDFHSTHHAQRIAAESGARALPVQHHHAHIAAVCAEHGFFGPVIGLALDGVGLGSDGTPWGGELLRVDGARCERLGHLTPLALPGGDRAAREPWRMAAAVLYDLGRGGEVAARYAGEAAVPTVLAMLERGLNCPRTSSAGRLFDAASGLLGLCLRMEMDAEAAIKLEAAATRYVAANGWPEPMADGWRVDDGVLDLRPLLGRLADAPCAALAGNVSTAEMDEGGARPANDAPAIAGAVAQVEVSAVDAAAAQFHATLVAALAEWAARACEANRIGTVALGGGCFFNRLLATRLPAALAADGIEVLAPKQLVPGDAGLALGQAWVALHALAA